MILKIKYLIVSLLITFIFAGCIEQIKSPLMPVWDVAYTIPVVNRTEVIIDRIKGIKGIFVDSSTHNLLIKFDSTRLESKPLEEIFKNEIRYENEFTLKPQNVDTLKFESFVSDDSVSLEEFHLYKGILNYEVFNYLNKKVEISVVIPGFTKPTGGSIDTLKFEVSVLPNSSTKKLIDLKNYRYRYTQNPFGGTNYGFYIKGHAKIDAGYSGDSVKTRVEIRDLEFNSLKGKVKPYDDEIKPKTITIDVDKDAKEILPKVNVYGAKLIIAPNTTARDLEVRLKDFEVTGFYKISPYRKNLKIKNRTVIDTIISFDQPSFVFYLDDIDINDFLNPQIPDSITYKGRIIVNPEYKSIYVTLPDTISYSVQFQIYSVFKIDSVSRTDTLEVEINEDVKKQIDKFNEGSISIDVDNGLPIGFTVTGFLLDSLNRKLIYFTRENGGETPSDTVFSISPAPIDAEGKVTNINRQKKIFALKKDEIEKIKSAKKVVLNVILYTTEGRKVLFRSIDRITFKVSSTIKIRVQGD